MPQKRPPRNCRTERGVTSSNSSKPVACSRRKLPTALNATPKASAPATRVCPRRELGESKSLSRTNSASSTTANQPHLVNRAVQEYSWSQAIGLRSSVRLVFQRKKARQKSEFEKIFTQRGCSRAADSSCHVAFSRLMLARRIKTNSINEQEMLVPTNHASPPNIVEPLQAAKMSRWCPKLEIAASPKAQSSASTIT